MTKQPTIKRIPRDQVERVIDADLARLAKSMRAVLRRAYPNPCERGIAAAKIMQSLVDAASA